MTLRARKSTHVFAVASSGMAAVALSACTAPGGDEPDSSEISVGAIEVTQAFQTSTNSVDLVSERSIAVRARVQTDTGDIATGVSGRLHIYVNGTAITPAAGLAAINAPFTAPTAATWDRNQEDHTLNFELPAPTGISPSSDVDFEVVLDALAGETNTSDNTGRVDDLNVVQRLTPQLYFTRINYTPAGAGLPDIADVQANSGDVFVRGIYPVDDSDLNLYREGLFPTLTWSQDPNGNGTIDSSNGEHSDVLDWLESCRQLIVDADGGSGDDIFLYGWVEGNPIPSNGWGRTGGRVAFGNTQLSRHQRTYAHELGHNFGLSHNIRTLSPDTGWDTGARLDDNPPANNTTGRVKPSTMNDVMVGGQLTNTAWVDQTTYEYFLGHEVLDPAGGSGPDRGKRRVRGVIVVSGILSLDGRELVRMNPSFRYPWLSGVSLQGPGDQYAVEVTDNNGDIYDTSFNGILGDDTQEAGDTFGFFSVRLAVPPDRSVERVRLISRADGNVLGQMTRTAPPRITLDDPPGGFRLQGAVTLTFRLEDPDTPLDQVRVQFAYSPDGTRWVPIAVNVPGTATSVVFDAAQIENTADDGTGLIRAIASDGLNTAFDEIGRLTVRDGRTPK